MAGKPKEDEKLKQTSLKNRAGPPYSAITIDTCICRRNHYRFEDGILSTLNKLQVPFVISEIISREVKSHLHQKKNDLLSKIRSVTTEAKWDILNSDEKLQISALKEMVQEIPPTRKWDNFLTLLKADVVDSEHCDMRDVVEAYFKLRPPFHNPKKKNEFPDAIALLSLEKWAREKGKKILAFSSDDDWLSFSEQSDYIDVISDIEFGQRQLLEGKVKEWIHEFISKINTEKYQCSETIEALLDEQVTLNPGKVDESDSSSTHGNVRGEILSIGYHDLSLTFSADERELDLNVIINTFKNTTFTIQGRIIISAEADMVHYEISMYDYTERILSDGDVAKVDEVEISVQLLFSLSGDVTAEGYNPTIDEISILSDLEIPFGKVPLPSSSRLDTDDDRPY